MSKFKLSKVLWLIFFLCMPSVVLAENDLKGYFETKKEYESIDFESIDPDYLADIYSYEIDDKYDVEIIQNEESYTDDTVNEAEGNIAYRSTSPDENDKLRTICTFSNIYDDNTRELLEVKVSYSYAWKENPIVARRDIISIYVLDEAGRYLPFNRQNSGFKAENYYRIIHNQNRIETKLFTEYDNPYDYGNEIASYADLPKGAFQGYHGYVRFSLRPRIKGSMYQRGYGKHLMEIPVSTVYLHSKDPFAPLSISVSNMGLNYTPDWGYDEVYIDKTLYYSINFIQ